MKIFETVPIIEVIDGANAGIFEYLFRDTELEFLKHEFAQSYYLGNSYSKTVANFYKVAIENTSKQNADLLVSTIIRTRFLDKWLKVNEQLQLSYNPLDEYLHDESGKKDGSNTDIFSGTKTSEDTKTTTIERTDTTEYDTTVTDNGKLSSKEDTTTSTDYESNRYGYNSPQAVPISTDTNSENVSKIRDPSQNYTEDTSIKSGTDTVTVDDTTTSTNNITDTDSSTNSKEYDESYSSNKKGRTQSPAKLIENEVKMRSKILFQEIVFSDIDSVLTLSIY